MSAFSWAKERYAAVGVDVEAAIAAALAAPISLHCWQGDDVRGFLFGDAELSGGIMATGSHPGRAGNADELRALLTRALALLPGAHKLNLHAIYADTDQKVDLPDLRPEHFAPWVDFARAQGLGLDFNPTCFSHPMAASGLTLSHPDPAVADFWSAHLAGVGRGTGGRGCQGVGPGVGVAVAVSAADSPGVGEINSNVGITVGLHPNVNSITPANSQSVIKRTCLFMAPSRITNSYRKCGYSKWLSHMGRRIE